MKHESKNNTKVPISFSSLSVTTDSSWECLDMAIPLTHQLVVVE